MKRKDQGVFRKRPTGAEDRTGRWSGTAPSIAKMPHGDSGTGMELLRESRNWATHDERVSNNPFQLVDRNATTTANLHIIQLSAFHQVVDCTAAERQLSGCLRHGQQPGFPTCVGMFADLFYRRVPHCSRSKSSKSVYVDPPVFTGPYSLPTAFHCGATKTSLACPTKCSLSI